MEELYTWIITWLCTWIITFVITFFTTRASLKQEIFKTKYDYDKRLLEERLKYYPKLLEITQNLWKSSENKSEEISLIKEADKKLWEWRHEWTWFLILWNNSLRYFYKLKEKLWKKPLNPEKGYWDELEKIFYLRSKLRKSLKDDIWIKISNYKD